MRVPLVRTRRRELQTVADEELMPMIADGDASAFEVLYDRHIEAAYSLAYRILGEDHRAEDVTQEALVSIWRSGARYDRSRGSVRSWILGIARNQAIDALRAGSLATRKLANDDDLTLAAEPAAERTEDEALDRETSRELVAAVKALPADQARVIALSYYGGFSQSEIAEIVGEPLGTVKGRTRLGLEKIRFALAEGVVG